MKTRHIYARIRAIGELRLKRFVPGLAASLLLLWATEPAVTPADVSDKRACRLGEPLCVQLVIKEMNRRFRGLARTCDHNAIFSLLYLRTTEKFRETLDTIGYHDPASVVREDAEFAAAYFRAYDAYHEGHGYVPPAWQLAFAAADQRALFSAGNALLGINAHIQRDLPFVLFDLEQDGHPVSYEDHNLVNNFLAQVDVTAEIVARFDPTFDDNSDPAALQQLIVSWRELAFVNYRRLRNAPTVEARATVAAEIEAAAATAATGILQQTAYPPGMDSSTRDAYCCAARKDRQD